MRATVKAAAIAAFYVVVGGLWAADYFPLQNFYAQEEIKASLREELGVVGAIDSQAYQDAMGRQQIYALSHPDIYATEAKLALYGAILLWGTVALGVGGGVLFLTRRRGSQAGKGAAQ